MDELNERIRKSLRQLPVSKYKRNILPWVMNALKINKGGIPVTATEVDIKYAIYEVLNSQGTKEARLLAEIAYNQVSMLNRIHDYGKDSPQARKLNEEINKPAIKKLKAELVIVQKGE